MILFFALSLCGFTKWQVIIHDTVDAESTATITTTVTGMYCTFVDRLRRGGIPPGYKKPCPRGHPL